MKKPFTAKSKQVRFMKIFVVQAPAAWHGENPEPIRSNLRLPKLNFARQASVLPLIGSAIAGWSNTSANSFN